ncbi:chaperone modulator CbpM [Acinetobacter puyangensis]|jgi:hypothetical protein|uniref:Chaperone modulatory protein CbpM n=1 Tax=Acinetobacter puyangensis TaxID=1096779 RepID=A0A240E944_9GAMM|nr:chaperone modulator CbpM [Acinetobacter puyangensis]SNX44435.1 chaperone modulatory protein CbpM [Acinetobacter puyangensis]
MSKITIREIQIPHVCDSEIVDQHSSLNFIQFVQACGQDESWVFQLFEYDILSSPTNDPKHHQFLGEDLARARRAYRLQRDFDASFRAVAVMLDLIDEVQHLRKKIR